jgi:TRAP-type mannitol/chloroaromatic compound transport system permease small subunit
VAGAAPRLVRGGFRADIEMQILTILDRALGAVIVAVNNIGSLLVVVMTIVVVADVTGRYIFNSPINGTAEIVTMLVVVVLYMQLAYTLRSGRMTRSDAFYTRLVERRPAIGNALGCLFNIGGACLAAIVMIGAWPKWTAAWQNNYYIGVIDVFTFPEWPLLLTIFLGCGLTGLQFVSLAFGNVLIICGAAPPGPSEPH